MPEQQISLLQITEQKRAKKAWQAAYAHRNSMEYGKRAQGFAVDIQTNGLLQTLAAYNAGGKDFEKELVLSIEQWLFSSDCAFPWGNVTQTSIIERLCNCESEKYRRAQTETLSFILWLKRFAKA